jgi:Undecaprenyl-phosphate glucose phosphotransferase
MEATARPGRLAPFTGQVSAFLRRASKQKIIGIVLTIDMLVLALTGMIFARIALPLRPGDEALAAMIIVGVTLGAIAILQRLWAYTVPALGALARQVRALIIALVGAFTLVAGLAFLAGIDIMPFRLWFLAWLLALIMLLAPFRVMVALLLSAAEKRGELARRAVVVGGGKQCEDLILRLARSNSKAIRILGVFDDRQDERSPDTIGLFRKIGTFDELEAYCRDNWVDLLIVALPPSAEERILQLIRKLWELPIDVRIAAHSSRLKLSKRAYSYVGDVPFLAVFDRPLSDWNAAVKAIFDRVVGATALLALSPVMLAVALAVKLDSRGPILFRQKRHGFNNDLVWIYKFRSMYVDMADADAARQVTRGDPRVTRVGRFIRKTSLDELPQLINVVTGQLSLVGPRPHAVATKAGNTLYQEAIDGYFARHRMKPGITGWAQINGWRGETDTLEKLERRIEHDLHYIDNWSLAFDLYILAMTPLSLFNTKNAY